MSLYQEQSANIRKTWLLITIFLVITILVGWTMSYVFENPAMFYGAIVFSFVQTALAYWFSDKITLASVHAKRVNRTEYFDLWNAVENLSITAGIPMPRVYIIPDPAPNAFATGRNEKHSAVAVTSGLLETLDKTELEGVIAHELSHIKNRDVLVSSVVVVLVGLFAILSDIVLRSTFLQGHGEGNKNGGNLLALIGMVVLILSPIMGMIIQFAISRRREFLADASGALLTRYPEGLASALRKISASPMKMRSASNATAHLFIASPFGATKARGETGGLSKLFMTHPPVEERIEKLLNYNK